MSNLNRPKTKMFSFYQNKKSPAASSSGGRFELRMVGRLETPHKGVAGG